jgi:hypothetical protein
MLSSLALRGSQLGQDVFNGQTATAKDGLTAENGGIDRDAFQQLLLVHGISC